MLEGLKVLLAQLAPALASTSPVVCMPDWWPTKSAVLRISHERRATAQSGNPATRSGSTGSATAASIATSLTIHK